MRKITLLSCLLLLTVSGVFSQSRLLFEWEKVTGGIGADVVKGIAEATNGDYLVLGETNSVLRDTVSNSVSTTTSLFVSRFSNRGWRTYSLNYGYAGYNYSAGGIAATSDGGYIIVGTADRSCRNPGDPSEGSDIVVFKVDRYGYYTEWARCYGSTAADQGADIMQLPNGNYAVTGAVGGNDLQGTGNHGGSDIWVAILSPDGNVLQSQVIGGTGNDIPHSMHLTNDGGLIIAGQTNSTDGNITGLHGSGATNDALLVKISAGGLPEWARCYGNNSNQAFNQVVQDANGNYYAIGYSAGQNGGDINSWHTDAYGNGGSDSWLIKTNSAGNIIWERSYGQAGDDNGKSLALTNNGELAMTGTTGIETGALGSGLFTPVIWVAKLNGNNGTVTDQRIVSGSNNWPESPVILNSSKNRLVLSATIGATESNASRYLGGASDGWLVQFGNSNIIKGFVYMDRNNNGRRDDDELADDREAKISLSKIATPEWRLFSIRNGFFQYLVDTGNYSTQLMVNSPYFQITPEQHNSRFSSYGLTDSFDYRITAIPDKSDLQVSALGSELLRMGTPSSITIDYFNSGTTTLNAMVYFRKDSRSTLSNFSTTNFTEQGDSVVFPVGSLAPLRGGQISFLIRPATPPILDINSILRHEVSIGHEASDETPYNNFQQLQQRIVGSSDPNDKGELTAAGSVSARQVADKTRLLYRINFQNIGNDTAFRVVIRDTLHDYLDAASFRMVAASHNYRYSITDKGIIEWTFDDINLPDDKRNEPGSHGYIIFSLSPLQTLQTGDVIPNKASIYFDYNLPVHTNTTLTRVSADMLPTPLIRSLATSYCASAGEVKGSIGNIPVNGRVPDVHVMLDGTSLVLSGNMFSVIPGDLAPGTHQVTAYFTDGTDTTKTSFAFSVQASIDPVVGFDSDHIIFEEADLPAVIEAHRLQGEGKASFTFATDRQFTHIIGNTGADSTLAVNMNWASEGTSPIYVKMSTDAACSDMREAYDSVLVTIHRKKENGDSPTGYQDITAYPNPVGSTVQIRHLDNNRRYMLKVNSLHGHTLLSAKVEKASQAQVNIIALPAGVYILNIYDGQTGKVLKAIKLLKR